MTRRAVLVLAALLVVACTGGDDDAGPSPTTQATSSTSVVDLSGVFLPDVGGETTTTSNETGTTQLVGSVRGSTGPLAGATVRIDRITAGGEVSRDLLTGPDGRWELRDVPGGRYRVRAFLAPTFAQSTAEVRFLTANEEHSFDLVVEDQRDLVVRAAAAPNPPVVGSAVNVVVLVVQRTVDPDGIVRSMPLAGVTVELIGLGPWDLRDDGATKSTTSTTVARPSSVSVRLSDDGRARFELRCLAAGPSGLALRVPVAVQAAPGTATTVAPATTATTEPLVTVQTVALDLPACAAAASAPTTSSTTAGGSSTTSRAP